jgi:hypothetical protein
VPHAGPLNTSLDRRGEIEAKLSAIDAESKKRRMWRSRLKRTKPNPVLQRSARSQVLMLLPSAHARPLNTSLDRSEVIEVKRSAVGAESKKGPRRRSRLKQAKPNQVLQRSARSEVLHLEPVRHARPLNTALDHRGEIEVKLSAAGRESKKRPSGGVR